MQLVGNYLDQVEIKELISTFNNKLKFQNLIREMKQQEKFDFNEDTVEVIQALKFDVVKGNDVISAKSLYLKVNDNVKIKYLVRHLNGDKETTNDFFIGSITRNSDDGEGFTVTHFKARHDTFISSFETRLTEEAIKAAAEVDTQAKEEFPIDENYYPGMLLDQVDSEGFLDGCLPGGYIWCGMKCGGSVACTSSQYGINELDHCCKSHDCCYSRNNVDYPNCYCDQRLCDCAQAAPAYGMTPVVEAIFCFVC
ncbi:hypothetical protein HNQ85_001820 [Anoxybacillus calidus]|jgi:hypothetical protein|uniref:Uncharacterized protein n=1 Tax=[Anoxybacillus] calidus TaxID=575178 RepID=A0A7V9Z0A4_9BACL|nr:hypothetical protein [Anoxybacillus calidus]MBA2871550.1 hypothetical protein [Anoxybacillus calidus]